MMLLFVLFNYLFFNLSFAFPSLVVDNSNESQGRMKRDVKYYFLTHTGLPENSDLWMYMAIFAFFYLLIAAIAYTITFIFYRPSEKKEEYPILKQEEVSSIVADKSKASTSSISYDEGSKTPEPSVASALTNSEDRPPSSMMSLSEREHQEEVRKTRSKMKTAKGEFISSRNSLSEMKLVEELKADMKTSKSAVSTKTAKMAPKEKLSRTTSTSTSQGETSTSESSSEKSEVRPDNSDSGGHESDSDSNDKE